MAITNINNKQILVIKDARGIIIRFPIDKLEQEYFNLSEETLSYIASLEKFLAKIKNPVIIEVHTDSTVCKTIKGLKNWEISTVIADNIRDYVVRHIINLENDMVFAVGFGEFLPFKNTPYNGGKFLNRVDIIILCNVSGE